MRVAVCVFALATALTLSGCVNPFQNVVEGLAGQDLPHGAGETLKEMTDGGVPGFGSSEVPADFPAGIPLPDAKPMNAVRYTEANVVSWALQYRDDIGSSAVETLGKELVAQGYAEDSNTALGTQMVVAIYSNDDYTVTLSTLGEDGDRLLQILVMQLTTN
jgi:hypothetical protein